MGEVVAVVQKAAMETRDSARNSLKAFHLVQTFDTKSGKESRHGALMLPLTSIAGENICFVLDVELDVLRCYSGQVARVIETLTTINFKLTTRGMSK